MAAAALDGLPVESDIREQMHHIWFHWSRWAASAPPEAPDARASGRIGRYHPTKPSDCVHETMAGLARLLERSRECGPMRDAPLGFVVALMNAMADATIDFMIQDPANADKHGTAAFEALWRMIA